MSQKEQTKVCKHCNAEIPKNAKVCSQCQKKQGGALKWVIIGVVAVALIGGAAGNSNSDPADNQQASNGTVITSAPETPLPTNPANTPEGTEQPKAATDVPANPEQENDNIPTEYKSALKSAENYSDLMHMSKAGIYDQLVSPYGDKFSPEAAQYAIDNVDIDWNANALEKAKDYSDSMAMSKAGIYDQLISEYGEKFTPEEAQYAVDNVAADWKENALKKAKDYQSMNMSPERIRDQLTSEYGEKFTSEEADYAIQNLQ